MLEARKNRLFEKIFALYSRNLFKRRFHSLRVQGLENLEKIRKNTPLIVYSNHSSWWDGLIVFEISRLTSFKFFVMMEERQLRNLQPFRLLGAFSVVRENPREAVRSINYAAKILRSETNAMLLIFPQGEILPNDRRPLKFYNGAARIVEKTESIFAVPLAMRYEFTGEFKPEIFVKIGNPEYFDRENRPRARELTEKFEKQIKTQLNFLTDAITARDFRGFTDIL